MRSCGSASSKRFTAEEIAVLVVASVVQNNVVYPYFVELALGLPAGSPKSVETQVDLMFAILTEKLDAATDEPVAELPDAARRPVATAAPPSETVV